MAMTQESFSIPAEFIATANTSPEDYKKDYQRSIASPEDNDAYWAERAEDIHWMTKPTKIN